MRVQSRFALLSLSLLTAVGCQAQTQPEPVVSSDSSSSSSFGDSSSESDAGSGSESGTETGEAEQPSIAVQWIEVAASDYKLELEPEFDAQITSYTALADGPEISVYVDVIVNADVEGVLVNDVPATLNGFRTWRSLDTELISPTSIEIEVQAPSAPPPVYSVEITVP